KFEILINSMPFYLLLSNLGPSIFGALFTEYMSLLCLAILVLYVLNLKEYKIDYIQIPIFGMIILFVLSYIVSLEYEILYKGFLNGIFLFSIYGLTRVTIKNYDGVVTFFESFLIAIFFTTIIILFSYYSKIDLNNIDRTLNENIYSQTLVQGNFFYTAILYLTAISIIISINLMILSNTNSRKILILIMILIIIFGVSVYWNKTVLVTLLFVGMIVIFNNLFKRRLKIKNILLVIFAIFLLTLLIYLFYIQEQSSIRQFNLSSLRARFLVYESAFYTLFENIYFIFFGLGPESAFRLDIEIYSKAKTHIYSTEGAIDSAYISYIYEYGIFFTTLFIIYVLFLMILLFSKKNKNLKANINLDTFSYTLGLVCLSVMTMALTQVLGMGKISAVIFQIFACAEVIINEKKYKL
ncbi:hypothetical protein OAA70_03300, partial [Candidatus Pelagibacter sp.]|nr:hypothetical protein [Candidatus Pelagibacter sp.]